MSEPDIEIVDEWSDLYGYQEIADAIMDAKAQITERTGGRFDPDTTVRVAAADQGELGNDFRVVGLRLTYETIGEEEIYEIVLLAADVS
ncbi:MAG TPA: hypothetical protein VGB70_12865 [Allosphingosinicella sp.]|jgi:hypothetical protein